MNETTLTTLSNLKDAFSTAVAHHGVWIKDETILNIRNALIKLTEDEARTVITTIWGIGEESLEYTAESILTCACHKAEEAIVSAKEYCNIEVDQSKINFERCACVAVGEYTYQNTLLLNMAAKKGFEVDDWGKSCEGHVALGTSVELYDVKYIVTAHYKEEDAASENYPEYADYYVIKEA